MLFRIYRYLNLLSIDVAVGAMVCALFFSSIFQTHIRWTEVTSLGLTVWIIYTLDHLLDAHRVKTSASSNRHRFHQDNFKTLISILVVAILMNVSCIFFIRDSVLFGGIALAVFVSLYFLINRYLVLMKELMASIIYTAGVIMPSVVTTQVTFSWQHFISISIFVITALINLILFSSFDHEHDIKDKQHSLVTSLGTKKAEAFTSILFLVNTVLFIEFVRLLPNQPYAWILLAMNAVLLIIFLFKKQFAINDRYRLAGDAVFLFPMVSLIPCLS